MPKFGSTNGKAPAISSTGAGGGFIRQPGLVGELVIITPVALKLGKYKEGTPEERETRQLTSDVIVLTGPNKGKHPGMYLSGKPIVDKGVEILESEADTPVEDRTVLAGRMTRKTLKRFRAHWPTPADLERAIADPGVVVPSNSYTWLVPDANEADMALVMSYYEQGGEVPSGTDEEDPFED